MISNQQVTQIFLIISKYTNKKNVYLPLKNRYKKI